MTTLSRVSCALLLLGALLQAAAADLKVGDVAPDFTLAGSDGKTYKLSEFKDKKAVVVAWFPKAFTPGCTAECKSMRADGKAIRDFEVAYFAASVDDVETNKRFAESLELDFPILCDPTKATATAYGVVTPQRAVPFRWTYFIAKDGTIAHIEKGVQAGSHGKDIAAKLKELGVQTASK